MKSFISKFSKLLRNKNTSLALMIIGLDNSGKTSILNNLISVQRDNNPSEVGLDRQTSGDFTHSSSDDLMSGRLESSESVITNKLNKTDEQYCNVAPTAGYNYERVRFRDHMLTVLDFSGKNRYRGLWQEFFDSIDGIIFVIDSSDLIRLVVVKDELELLLSHQYFATLSSSSKPPFSGSNQSIIQKQVKINQGRLIQRPLEVSGSKSHIEGCSEASKRRTQVPILFLANKSDLSNSIDIEVIVKALNLERLPQSRHPWFIQATSVTLNKGIIEGFDWLMNKLCQNR